LKLERKLGPEKEERNSGLLKKKRKKRKKGGGEEHQSNLQPHRPRKRGGGAVSLEKTFVPFTAGRRGEKKERKEMGTLALDTTANGRGGKGGILPAPKKTTKVLYHAKEKREKWGDLLSQREDIAGGSCLELGVVSHSEKKGETIRR